MTLLINLFNSQTDLGLFVLRIAIGIIFIYHGNMKLKMWNMEPSEQMPAKMLNLFKFLGVVETLGAISMLTGFLVQLSGIGLAIIMFGAIIMKRNQMNVGFAAQDNTGWEFDFILLTASLLLFFFGGGSFSIDQLILG